LELTAKQQPLLYALEHRPGQGATGGKKVPQFDLACRLSVKAEREN
jgi:hypothetical protein